MIVVDENGDPGGFDAVGEGGVEFYGAGQCALLQLREFRVLQQQNPRFLLGAQNLSCEGRWQCSAKMRHVVDPHCSQVFGKTTDIFTGEKGGIVILVSC